jgi:hypothetical protein
MVDLLVYAQQCLQAAEALARETGRIALGMTQTGLTLTVLDIQNNGIPSKARYSTKLVPTWYFKYKALNAAGRQYVKKNKLGTWGGFRTAQGLPSSVVNLTYSGRMLRSLQPLLVSSAGGRAKARIVASTREDANKLKYTTERYGDFLEPTPSTRGEVTLYAVRETESIIRRYVTP